MTKHLRHKDCDLAYTVTGNGPPVIFIQGVGVHGSGWAPQVAALLDRFTCLSFDNRGIGLSQPRPSSLTVLQMADDALALMNAEAWESAHVVGHSLGGLVALCLALEARQRVRSLSLLCTFARGGDATRLTGRLLWLGLRSRIGTRTMRREGFLQMILPPDAFAAADRVAVATKMAGLFGHDLADHSAVTLAQMRAMAGYDASLRLHELQSIPALVVSARHDPIARPELGRAMAANIRAARFVELANSSHGAPITDAAEVNALLLGHLDAC